MKNDSEYEKARQDAYAPLVDRVEERHRDKIFIYTLSCGLGWKAIVFKLVDELDMLWNGFQGKKGADCWKILQVKEKFGGLRFYVEFLEGSGKEAPDRLEASRKAIDVAETEASKTCERCGEPGKLNGKGYIATVCDECHKRWEERTSKGLWPTLFG
jgi:hypothetical protein